MLCRFVPRTILNVYIPFCTFLRKFRFLTVVATMRTADLWQLAWAKYQATGEKLSAVIHSRLSTVTLP
jgi:hypothetical protein